MKAGSPYVRVPAQAIGLATVGIGFYNIGVFVSGLFYAIPDYSACTH
jgi:hypothetical protein